MCVYHIVVCVVLCCLSALCCLSLDGICVLVCGYADNNIGDVGAQAIGDGLKSLTSLATLYLNSG